MLSALILANLAAWIWAWLAFGAFPALLGTAFLAYMFGLRHAFDADHIAAIDNVVRKLMQARKAPVSAGFFFALGHSSVVVGAAIAIVVATATMQRDIAWFRIAGGTIGTAVSAGFLLIVGLANLAALRGIWASVVRARQGNRVPEDDLTGGPFAKLFRPVFGLVSRSWHLYPVGLLFGLGFDTATEIGLLGMSATQAAQGLSIWSILVFPTLFTAGMSLMDTADSVLMTGAYGWALIKPTRKLWYNLAITAASVMVAFFVGVIEVLGLIRQKLMLAGPLWDAVGHLNDHLANFGFAVTAVVILSWCGSAFIYRQFAVQDGAK